MNDNKPREWRIDETHMNDDYSCVSSEPVENCIRVIEKSAYDAAIKERDELKQRLHAIEKGNATCLDCGSDKSNGVVKHAELLSIIDTQSVALEIIGKSIPESIATSELEIEQTNVAYIILTETTARLKALGGGE